MGRDRETVRRQGDDYHPWQYACDFTDNYLAEDSQVDVWEGDALERAKALIARYRGQR